MRNSFKWYFDFIENDLDTQWKVSTLIVDTNVLLDLYRYHNDTREDILSALESFSDRIWIAHQTAAEFIKNRKKVIIEAQNNFKKGISSINELQKSFDKLKTDLNTHRSFSKKFVNDLMSDAEILISKSSKTAEEELKIHKDYLKDDDILKRLLTLFQGNIGTSIENIDAEKIEANRRIAQEIPPGFRDKAKDGERSYGDYFMWREILKFAQNTKRPIIFVTSERKDDWWEEISGKILGPRPELINEFAEHSEFPLVMYHTENFLRLYLEQKGKTTDGDTINDIIELAHIRDLSTTAKKTYVHNKRQDNVSDDATERTGFIDITISEPVKYFTVTGSLEPKMGSIPDVSAMMLEQPDGAEAASVKAGAGTTYDFNIHVRAPKGGKLLPAGEYSFVYWAKCDAEEIVDIFG